MAEPLGKAKAPFGSPPSCWAGRPKQRVFAWVVQMKFPDLSITLSYMRLLTRSSPRLKVEGITMAKDPKRPPSSVLLWIVMIPLAAVMVAAVIYVTVPIFIPALFQTRP